MQTDRQVKSGLFVWPEYHVLQLHLNNNLHAQVYNQDSDGWGCKRSRRWEKGNYNETENAVTIIGIQSLTVGL